MAKNRHIFPTCGLVLFRVAQPEDVQLEVISGGEHIGLVLESEVVDRPNALEIGRLSYAFESN